MVRIIQPDKRLRPGAGGMTMVRIIQPDKRLRPGGWRHDDG